MLRQAAPPQGTVRRQVKTERGFSVTVCDFGGPKEAGAVLLFLPANGFHGMVYEPMALVLRSSFHCLALDFPDQGSSDPAPEADSVVEHFAAAVQAALKLLKYTELCVFGHSIGAQVALLLEARQPGLFTAMYMWECVIHDPAIMWYDTVGVDGDLSIAAVARKRKRRFHSLEAAMVGYAAKVPFCYWRADVLRLYCEHGFKAHPEGGVQLCCSPEAEARCYNNSELQCPELWAAGPSITCPIVCASGQDLSSTSLFRGPEIAAEPLAKRLGNATFERHRHMTHLGPFQQPGFVAERCLEHFSKVLASRHPHARL